MAHHPNSLKADYTIATVSVTLVLLLLGAVSYILLNAYSSTSAVRSELCFSLMLSDTVTHTQRASIERRMGLHPAIASWRYLSADEAARDFQEYIGTDFIDFLGENPLPASYELTLNAGHTDPSDLTALERECTSWKGVEEVAYQQKIIDAVLRNLNRLNYLLLGLGIFLLAVAIMLISNTLRLAIAARRQAIATMRLVGATSAFIRRPFIRRSFTQGVVAGVLASLLLYLFADGLSEVMPDIRLSTDRATLFLLFCTMILAGVTICTTFTALAVNRFVRHTD
ncbi:permease-like cell division protein FtsX [uncultured Rikenella sp.]|uniref:cell division protein FtsX n=1 Tax=uncultured Rikenella sp. TaxID=368003 RepID=UPI0025F2848E|nr:permease-like cell division protein FtsX [uncultured Rikenella sp.]